MSRPMAWIMVKHRRRRGKSTLYHGTGCLNYSNAGKIKHICYFCFEDYMQLDKNQQAFLTLVRAGLWEKEARLLSSDVVDYLEVICMAREQSVVGLVATGLEHLQNSVVPKDVALSLAGAMLQLEHRNRAMNEFVVKLMQQLRDAGVYALLVKGQGIAQCYERPLWRASGDIDLLLDAENYTKAVDFLSCIAQKTEGEDDYKKHRAFVIDSWEVECHGTLRSVLWRRLDKGIDAVQDDTFTNGSVRVWQNGASDVHIPAADNDVVFVFCHILQHFFKSGIGLRQICDWCRLLWTFRDSLSSELLLHRLSSMGALGEWRAFAALAVDYLGMPADVMPLYCDERRWRRKAAQILKLVFRTGNMGHNLDWSYVKRSPYLVRKAISFGRHCGAALRHLMIFPWHSVCVWWRVVLEGVAGVARGI